MGFLILKRYPSFYKIEWCWKLFCLCFEWFYIPGTDLCQKYLLNNVRNNNEICRSVFGMENCKRLSIPRSQNGHIDKPLICSDVQAYVWTTLLFEVQQVILVVSQRPTLIIVVRASFMKLTIGVHFHFSITT